MIGRLRSMLKRVSRSVRLVAIALAGLLVLTIVVSALSPAPPPDHRTRLGTSAATAARSVPTTARAQRPSPLSAAELSVAREVAARFLEGYLAFAYGRASARLVAAVTPGLRHELLGERAQLTPVERHRHHRVVSLDAVGRAAGVVLVTAMIEDGGITTYPLRLILRREGDGWLVSGVDGG